MDARHLHQRPVHHTVHLPVSPEPHLRHQAAVVHGEGAAVVVDDERPALRDVVQPEPLLGVVHLAVCPPHLGDDVPRQLLCLLLRE